MLGTHDKFSPDGIACDIKAIADSDLHMGFDSSSEREALINAFCRFKDLNVSDRALQGGQTPTAT